MIVLEVLAAAAAGGCVGAAVTIRRMPFIVAAMTKTQRLAFARKVNKLADDT